LEGRDEIDLLSEMLLCINENFNKEKGLLNLGEEESIKRKKLAKMD